MVEVGEKLMVGFREGNGVLVRVIEVGEDVEGVFGFGVDIVR